jgi:hypothetical protein
MSRFTAEAVIADLTLEVRQTVADAAPPSATVRARLRSAARLLRLPIGRVADWFYGEVRRVEAHEADQIRHYAAEQRKKLRDAERREARLRVRLLAAGGGAAAAGGAAARRRRASGAAGTGRLPAPD